MTIVVQVSVGGAAFWKKSANGWSVFEAAEIEPKQPVWVVTDLPEETFTELSIPRIFGNDRARFIQRQLANRFPESYFRIALPPSQSGGIMERIVPPYQTLTAVEPSDRVELALAHIKSPIAGVWSASMLMAHIGQSSAMPQHLFVILCQPGSMRILFIKHRAPVLTRLVTTAQTIQEQASEVIRTLRHLENTHVVQRNAERFGVLLLGGSEEFAAKLTEDRLTLLTLPKKWRRLEIQNWNHVLFESVIQNPPGQLAPLKYRISYLALETTKYARIATAVGVLVAVFATASSTLHAIQIKQESEQLQQKLKLLAAEIATTDEAIAAYGVSPDMVRRAVALDREEIETAPDMSQHMIQVAEIISRQPTVRLKNWQWKLASKDEPICTQEDGKTSYQITSTDMGAQGVNNLSMSEQGPMRMVEIKLTIVFPESLSPSQLEKQTIEISNGLKTIKDVKLYQDPVKSILSGRISIATVAKAVTSPGTSWCFSLPANKENTHE